MNVITRIKLYVQISTNEKKTVTNRLFLTKAKIV
jgi:hypothetical protein